MGYGNIQSASQHCACIAATTTCEVSAHFAAPRNYFDSTQAGPTSKYCQIGVHMTDSRSPYYQEKNLHVNNLAILFTCWLTLANLLLHHVCAIKPVEHPANSCHSSHQLEMP